MKTILHLFSSSASHAFCEVPENSIWIAWKTYRLGSPFTARTPLQRKMSTPFSCKSHEIQSLSLVLQTSPGTSMPTEETRESCWWSCESSKNESSFIKTLSRENARIPKMKLMSTSLFVVRLIGTEALIARMRPSTSLRVASSTRSHLFSRTR